MPELTVADTHVAALRVLYGVADAEVGTLADDTQQPRHGQLPHYTAKVHLANGPTVSIGRRLTQLATPSARLRVSEGERAVLEQAGITVTDARKIEWDYRSRADTADTHVAALRVLYGMADAEVGTLADDTQQPRHGQLPHYTAKVHLANGPTVNIGRRLTQLATPSTTARVSEGERAVLEQAGITVTDARKIEWDYRSRADTADTHVAALRVLYGMADAEVGTLADDTQQPRHGQLPHYTAKVHLANGPTVNIGQRLTDLATPSARLRVSEGERAVLEQAGITVTDARKIEWDYRSRADTADTHVAALRVLYGMADAEVGTLAKGTQQPRHGQLPHYTAKVHLANGPTVNIGRRLTQLATPSGRPKVSEGERAVLEQAGITVTDARKILRPGANHVPRQLPSAPDGHAHAATVAAMVTGKPDSTGVPEREETQREASRTVSTHRGDFAAAAFQRSPGAHPTPADPTAGPTPPPPYRHRPPTTTRYGR
ncbi:hypothetical protein OG215_39985 (plasmid) [Streptomyces globisporus]|uniref:hypothetical protein n=1 Tax=Streptomyces globisporus TaxID=1908 RepID=UPI002F90877E|nr:hypothetical protein OG215_39985 [Streptomyces globisporus]